MVNLKGYTFAVNHRVAQRDCPDTLAALFGYWLALRAREDIAAARMWVPDAAPQVVGNDAEHELPCALHGDPPSPPESDPAAWLRVGMGMRDFHLLQGLSWVSKTS